MISTIDHKGPAMRDFKELVANNVRSFRRASGMTGEQFARHLGISRTHLYMIETAQSLNMRFNALYSLSKETDMNRFFNKSITIGLMEEKNHVE